MFKQKRPSIKKVEGWQAKRVFVKNNMPIVIQVWGFEQNLSFKIMLSTVKRVCNEPPISGYVEKVMALDPRRDKPALILPDDEFPAIVIGDQIFAKRKVVDSELSEAIIRINRIKTAITDKKVKQNKKLLSYYDFIKLHTRSFFHHPSTNSSATIIIPSSQVSINEFGSLSFDRTVGLFTFFKEDEEALIEKGYHVLDYTLRDKIIAKHADVYEELDLTKPLPVQLPLKFMKLDRGLA